LHISPSLVEIKKVRWSTTLKAEECLIRNVHNGTSPVKFRSWKIMLCCCVIHSMFLLKGQFGFARVVTVSSSAKQVTLTSRRRPRDKFPEFLSFDIVVSFISCKTVNIHCELMDGDIFLGGWWVVVAPGDEQRTSLCSVLCHVDICPCHVT